jgi:hypothetical protein
LDAAKKHFEKICPLRKFMGSERCSLLHRHPAAGVGGLEMAVGFQNSKFLSVHFFSIYHTGVYLLGSPITP